LWRRNGVFQADGRTNQVNAGRHSLDTHDRDEAIKAIQELDHVIAVRHGLIEPTAKRSGDLSAEALSLEKGVAIYMQRVAGPEVTGGTSKATQKRYRAVFDKFLEFVRGRGIETWNEVTKGVLESYAAWLNENSYADRTMYLELTTIKQTVAYLVNEKLLPETCRLIVALTKSHESSTYCYSQDDVVAIVEFCKDSERMRWLAGVFSALACTGLRISELANL